MRRETIAKLAAAVGRRWRLGADDVALLAAEPDRAVSAFIVSAYLWQLLGRETSGEKEAELVREKGWDEALLRGDHLGAVREVEYLCGW